jgi:N-carbamoylputrescine amidase
MSGVVRIGLVQQTCGEDKAANLAKSLSMVGEAAKQGAQLVVLQELHTGPYFCQNADTKNFERAESIPGPSSEKLSAAARELGIVLVGGLFEARAPGVCHNTAVVFDTDGSLAGMYRKMHIPDDPGYYEKFYFTPGDLGFSPIKTSCGTLGVLVCWDQWFPEAARLMALRGADILLYPTAIGWDPRDTADEKARQRDAWIISQRAHAVANGTFVAAVNRTGFEPDSSGALPGSEFWGSSFVAGPQGEIISMASTDREEVIVVNVDLKRAEEVRRIWPFFRDRRIDAYDGLTSRFLK